MDYRNLLNEEQYKGVSTTSQYTKVIAGAGSGKTRVLTYRVVYLIDKMGVSPSQIMGITFTNKAAKEIKDRVYKLLPDIENISLCTIHSWCASFLRRHSGYINYPKSFTIIDDDDQKTILKKILERHHIPKNSPIVKECLAWIGSKKTEGYQYYDLEGTVYPNDKLNQFLSYFKEYTEELNKSYALDFDDLLLKTIEILVNNPDNIRHRYQNYIKHILVDEFQDINDVQYHFIRLLMNKNTSLYVVGDPDQTIYTWRGANNSLILEFDDKIRYDYKDAEVETIILKNNYRSTKNILSIANKIIANNKDRIKKDLFPINENGEQVTYFNARTVGEEASFITHAIKERVGNGGKYKNFAILYRSNYLTREIEMHLNLHRIPYRIFGGLKFYQRKEIKDVVAYMDLLVNPASDVSFDRIINVPKRNIGPSAIDAIKKASDELGQPEYVCLLESLDNVELPKSKLQKLSEFVKIIEKTKEKISLSPTQEYSTIIDDMLSELGYFDYLKELDEGDDERKENVKELIGNITYFFKSNENAEFVDFINNVALQASQDEIDDGDYVSLMTVHTAKGLEYNTVFIYGFNQGVFPPQRVLDENNKKSIEEERRLAYVAITRAKKKLYITGNRDKSYVVGGANLEPSMFAYEAGLVEKKTKPDIFRYDDYVTPYSRSNNNYNNRKEKPKNIIPSNASNGVEKWEVGDYLEHEQFGIGEVIEVVSDKLIKVNFKKTNEIKTLLGSHAKIKKLIN